MSWSVAAVGKAAALHKKLEEDFASVKCSEPEDTIKNSVRDAVLLALTAYPSNFPLRVEASGSQSHPDFSKKPHETTHQLKVSIEPIYGFTE
jgi:hypothetical protein